MPTPNPVIINKWEDFVADLSNRWSTDVLMMISARRASGLWCDNEFSCRSITISYGQICIGIDIIVSLGTVSRT